MKSQNIQEDIEQYKKRIQDLENEVDSFKSWHKFHRSMSHELRTYLSPIIGYSRLLQGKTKLDEIQSNYVSILLSHGAYPLLNRINNYSDFNKLALGEIALETNSINAHMILNELMQELSSKVTEKGITLSCEVDQQIPKSIKSDGYRIKQILRELIENAIRFTIKGKVTISLKDSNSVLHFKIEDTGVGISPESLEKLGHMFESKFSSLDLRFGGLGLLIVKLLCDLFKGSVWVESQVDIGSTFYVTIPYETINA